MCRLLATSRTSSSQRADRLLPLCRFRRGGSNHVQIRRRLWHSTGRPAAFRCSRFRLGLQCVCATERSSDHERRAALLAGISLAVGLPVPLLLYLCVVACCLPRGAVVDAPCSYGKQLRTGERRQPSRRPSSDATGVGEGGSVKAIDMEKAIPHSSSAESKPA